MQKAKFVVAAVAIAVALAGLGVAITSSSDDRAAEIDAVLAASDLSADDRTSEIDATLAINELNEDAAESAPQQQVTNGWVARDLLALQAEQLNDISEQQVSIAMIERDLLDLQVRLSADLAKQQQQTNLILGLLTLVVASGVAVTALAGTRTSVRRKSFNAAPATPAPADETATAPPVAETATDTSTNT